MAFNTNAEQHELALFDLEASWTDRLIRPTDVAPIIIKGEAGFAVREMSWGYVSLDHARRAPIVNARSETLFELRNFREDALRTRCVIAARGFYEWEDTGEKRKRPWLFESPSRTLLWIAGIYKSSQAFCMVTTEPNRFVEAKHDRMPAILTHSEALAWLNPSTAQVDLQRILAPNPLELKASRHDPLKRTTQDSLF